LRLSQFSGLIFWFAPWDAWQLSEIQNGRLAMLALSGFFHHTIITGKGMLG
jgi:hypothetical protein